MRRQRECRGVHAGFFLALNPIVAIFACSSKQRLRGEGKIANRKQGLLPLDGRHRQKVPKRVMHGEVNTIPRRVFPSHDGWWIASGVPAERDAGLPQPPQSHPDSGALDMLLTALSRV